MSLATPAAPDLYEHAATLERVARELDAAASDARSLGVGIGDDRLYEVALHQVRLLAQRARRVADRHAAPPESPAQRAAAILDAPAPEWSA